MSVAIAWRSDGSVPHAALEAALRSVEDPEVPVSLVDLGLVREVTVAEGHVRVGITYTSIACPCNEMIRDDLVAALTVVPQVREVEVEDLFLPWSRADVTPEGRELLRAVAVV